MTNFPFGETVYRTDFFGSRTGETPATGLASGPHTVNVAAGGILDISTSTITNGFMSAITGLGQAGAANSIWTITVNGSVQANSVNASHTIIGTGLFNGFGAASNTLTVGVDGTLYGNDYGFASSARGTITNNGVINGERSAIWFGDGNTLSSFSMDTIYGVGATATNLFTNVGVSNSAANTAIINATNTVTNSVTGVISSGAEPRSPSGVAINSLGHTGLTVTNNGSINGGRDSIYDNSMMNMQHDGAVFAAGRLTLTNTVTGYMTGSVSTTWFNASVTNAGVLTGGVEMKLTTTQTTPAAPILFDTDRDGDFSDTVAGAVGVADVTTLTGLTLVNSGYIGGFSGTISGLSVPPSEQGFFTNAPFFSVIGADARDAVRNTGMISGSVDLQNGADSFANTGAAATVGDVYMGEGNDTITNSGRMNDIYSEDGDDRFTNTLTANGLSMGRGNDIATNSGAMQRVFMGEGQDSVSNTGSIGSSNFVFPSTVQTLINSRNFEGTNGSTNNILNTAGTLDVNMGAGNDTLTSTGSVGDWIDMGIGNDVMTGGANQDKVHEADGLDRYTLAAGIDTFYIAADDLFNDTIDGGTGVDILVLGNDGDGWVLDLATGTLQQNNGSTLSGNIDRITGFEQVYAGIDNDTIIGSAAADSIAGNSGADSITGGGGKDMLFGGDQADTFVFSAAGDSTASRAGRDIIMDFTDTGSGNDDLIHLTFDANTTNNRPTAITDAFDYAGIQYGGFTTEVVGEDAPRFLAGELRYHYEAGNTILRGDTNGDGRADFAIEFRGIFVLDSSDFLFST